MKIKGEDGDGKKEKDSFAAKSAWVRVKVLAAGVVMNFILAWVLLSGTFMLGSYQDVTGQHISGAKVLIEGIEDNSPAQKMNLHIGDELISGNGRVNFSTVEEVQAFIADNKGREISLIVQRGNEKLTLNGVPRSEIVEGQGALGISSLGEVVMVNYSFFKAFWMGLLEIGGIMLMMLDVLRKLLFGQHSGLTVTGIVGIAAYTGQIIPLGFSFLLRFAAILSVNLGIINILPFPALDGGRILFVLIEKIKGSRLNPKFANTANMVGFAILILLMLLVTYHDVVKLF